jgi:ribonuclease HI
VTRGALQEVTIYSDGACDPNPGKGGWAALIITPQGKMEISGRESESTNNRMEMTAAIRALKTLNNPSSVTIYTDSRYLQQGIDVWLTGWIKRGWRTTSGKVANRDLWEELLEAGKPHQVHWRWLKGHDGNLYNSRVDALARKARQKA